MYITYAYTSRSKEHSTRALNNLLQLINYIILLRIVILAILFPFSSSNAAKLRLNSGRRLSPFSFPSRGTETRGPFPSSRFENSGGGRLENSRTELLEVIAFVWLNWKLSCVIAFAETVGHKVCRMASVFPLLPSLHFLSRKYNYFATKNILRDVTNRFDIDGNRNLLFAIWVKIRRTRTRKKGSFSLPPYIYI